MILSSKRLQNDVSRKHVTQFIDSIATVKNVYLIVLKKMKKNITDKDDDPKNQYNLMFIEKGQQRQQLI